ncbi:AAA family ATPase [Corynebacterium sp. CCM 9204]|uniref:AAA family ATPase n=1 Tax=Corynebacterium sp. CCM 9204 TaxID=3057616 RepID=UPI0035262EAE
MVAEYTERYGTAPSNLAAKEMWQTAILETRDAKKPAELLADLRAQSAEEVTKHHRGDKLLDAVDAVAHGSAKAQCPLFSIDDHAADLAERIVSQVTDGCPVFRRSHIDTAISTALKGFRFGAVDRDTAHSAVMDSIFDSWAIDLSADELARLPAALRADDGREIDHRLNSEQFTTAAILDSEVRALDAVEEPTVIFTSADAIDRALAEHTRSEGFSLNSGQEELAGHLLTCGTVAATGVGPAGTGKTTSMKNVADVWRDSGHNLIGLVPSAAAARVLSDDIGSQATTIDSLTHTWLGNNPNKLGQDPAELPIEIKPGDILLVDDADMASTNHLAALIDIAHHADAVVRFIGDPMQLDAVDGGGLFNAMCRRSPTVELSEVMRFAKGRDTEQAAASLTIRNRDASGVALYDARGWVSGERREAMIIEAVDAYLADLDVGRSALIIAPTNHDVDTINEMIRAHHIDSGAVDTSREVTLARSDVAGVDDTIICRTNTVFRPNIDGVASRVINGNIDDHRGDHGRRKRRRARNEVRRPPGAARLLHRVVDAPRVRGDRAPIVGRDHRRNPRDHR